jgi:DNA-binding IclR family transcriptional regulator
MKEQVNSIIRVLDILECFSDISNSWSLGDLAARLGLPTTTVHRQLSTLITKGYIKQDVSRKTYSIGNRLILMSCAILSKYDLRNVAVPHLEKLSQTVGETVHLCQLDGFDMFYVDKVECQMSVSCNSRIGGRVHAHAGAAGKVLLSAQNEAVIDRYCQMLPDLPGYTVNTIGTPETLRAELDKVRLQGFAIDNEEVEIGLLCLAAPIYNMDRQCMAAVSISGPMFRMKSQVESFIPLLRHCTGEVSRMLGYKT